MTSVDQAASPLQGLGIGQITTGLRRASRRSKESEKKLHEAIVTGQSRAKVLEAIATLHETEQAITRQRIHIITGLSLYICDDHLDRFVQEGKLTRVVPGVYEVVKTYPETPPMSHTVLPDGTSKLEIDDVVLTLTPKMRRTLGKFFFADATEHNMLQANTDHNVLVSEMVTSMLLLRRGQEFQEEIGRQLGIAPDPLTKGLPDRLTVLAERFLSSRARTHN